MAKKDIMAATDVWREVESFGVFSRRYDDSERNSKAAK